MKDIIRAETLTWRESVESLKDLPDSDPIHTIRYVTSMPDNIFIKTEEGWKKRTFETPTSSTLIGTPEITKEDLDNFKIETDQTEQQAKEFMIELRKI